MYDPLAAAGGAGGGATGAGLGSLGRSPFLDLLKPLDYPRQALWNMVRGPARFLQGEGSLDDLLGMVPGLAGAGMAALGPLGMLGGALAGGAVQGLGKLTGSDAFEASTPQDITGTEDFLPNLAVGAATDPLTYTGFGLGHQAGGLAGSRMAMRAAEPALAEGPEGILQGFRMGMPQAGFERDAAVSGLGGRNQALGQAVGDVAQTLESRPQALASQVQEQLRPPELPGPPLEATPSPAGPLSPEQAFEQMLPAAQRYQRANAAFTNPRNFIPPEMGGMTREELAAVRDVPTSRLNEFLAPAEFPGGEWELNDEWAGRQPHPPEALAQFRRGNAATHVLQQSTRQLEQHAPLAAELARSGQLGPIESRLQTNWGILGDMAQDQYLSPQELLRHARIAQLEDEAFQTLFERTPQGASHQVAGQEAIMQQLLGEIGQAHPGLAGSSPGAALRSLDPSGLGDFRGPFGGNPVTQQQIEQARMARHLHGSLPPPAAGDWWGAHLANPEDVQALARNSAREREIMQELMNERAGSPHFAALHQEREALQAEFEQLRQAPRLPAGRRAIVPPPAPPGFQGGSVGQLGGGPAFPPLPEILSQAQNQVGRALQPWEVQELEQALMQRNPEPLQQRGILGDPGQVPRDVNPPLPRGADLEMQGQFAPGQQQGLGQFIEQLQEGLGRPLTAGERQMFMETPPARFQEILGHHPSDIESLLGGTVNRRELDQAIAEIYSVHPGTARIPARVLEEHLGRPLSQAELAYLQDTYR